MTYSDDYFLIELEESNLEMDEFDRDVELFLDMAFPTKNPAFINSVGQTLKRASQSGGFYKRGCQVKTLHLIRRGKGFY
jgi:hypothetical protein